MWFFSFLYLCLSAVEIFLDFFVSQRLPLVEF